MIAIKMQIFLFEGYFEDVKETDENLVLWFTLASW